MRESGAQVTVRFDPTVDGERGCVGACGLVRAVRSKGFGLRPLTVRWATVTRETAALHRSKHPPPIHRVYRKNLTCGLTHQATVDVAAPSP